MKDDASYVNLWKVCWIIFVLSHGQADVERGFNVNSKFLMENMKKISLVNQNIICDHLSEDKSELLIFCLDLYRLSQY